MAQRTMLRAAALLGALSVVVAGCGSGGDGGSGDGGGGIAPPSGDSVKVPPGKGGVPPGQAKDKPGKGKDKPAKDKPAKDKGKGKND